jgi:predicted nucleotidyltransferase
MVEAEKVRDLIPEIVEAIVSSARPERIILFGSRAKDTAQHDSDFDFLVVVSDVENEREISRWIYRALLDQRIKAAVDIVVVSEHKLAQHKDNPYFIYSEALREGNVCYERASTV